MSCEPGCERGPGVPCGKVHVPGSPCDYCGDPTPMTGDPCPKCWISLQGMALADMKALFAADGTFSIDPQEPGA